MHPTNPARRWVAAFIVALLGAFAPLACGPAVTGPGEEDGTDAGDLLADAGTSQDAAEPPASDADVALPDAEVSDADVTPDAGVPDAEVAPDAGSEPEGPADASEAAPDAGPPAADASVPGPDAGPDDWDGGQGELADCRPYPISTEADAYSAIAGLREQSLRDALYQRVKGHTTVGYDGAKIRMFGSGGFDVRGGKVECVYTGLLFNYDQLDRTNGYNTEHSWPQSQFGNEATTAKGDMHHLFPTEQKANSRRSSLPFGNTDCAATRCSWAQGGSECGPAIGSGGTVFEVRPERRGDIARAHFYFAVRYRASIPNDEEAALRCWHHCDPPDALERARNDAIEAIQHNRNPFVDRPEFVDAISDF